MRTKNHFRSFVIYSIMLAFLSAHNYGISSVYNIEEYGAVGDGKTICTEAIQTTINIASNNGGGEVYIPSGTFVSGTIWLKNNITLRLSNGAILKAIDDTTQYKKCKTKFFQEESSTKQFIIAEQAENISIEGSGIIDGNGSFFWEPKTKEREWIKPKPWRVIPMILFINCHNVSISKVNIINSPGWTVHLFKCKYVKIDGVKIKNELYGPNCDGFDIDGSTDITISNCLIETGDDAICLKTTKDSQDCERIVISNCIIRTNCAAFKIGTSSWYDFRDISITNLVVHQSSRVFQILPFDGALVENITISNVTCNTNAGITMPRPIHIDVRRRRDLKTDGFKNPKSIRPAHVRNINISDFIINTDGRILITSTDDCITENIHLSNIQMQYPWIEDPVMMKDKSDIMQSSNSTPDARLARAAVVVYGVKDFFMSDLMINWPNGKVPNNYLSKIEAGELIIDPKNTSIPAPKFNVFWGENINGGILNIPYAKPNVEGHDKYDLKNCDLIIK